MVPNCFMQSAKIQYFKYIKRTFNKARDFEYSVNNPTEKKAVFYICPFPINGRTKVQYLLKIVN